MKIKKIAKKGFLILALLLCVTQIGCGGVDGNSGSGSGSGGSVTGSGV